LLKPIDMDTLKSAVGRAIKLHRLAKLKQQALDVIGAQSAQVSDRTGLEVTFQKGLEALWMAYQPIVRTSTKEIFAYEALLRTKETTIPHPGAFLDIAERLERLPDLGRAVRASVAQDLLSAPENLTIFVNLHPLDLQDDDLIVDGSALVSFAPRVVFEITERASLAHDRHVSERIKQIKGRGFRIAVDDLGAGYSGLSSLASLSPEVAKIDMSLIRDIDTNPTKRALVRSLVETCQELDMVVVSEGIETPEERDTLISIGADLMQGYYFAKPSPPFCDVKW
ncbi:MAG: EAL domain-containing protein, partial [Deltaproteobacteria bacterium]|nr:EAL domain-containing protein [Deltaproteobacteria bacterium]